MKLCYWVVPILEKGSFPRATFFSLDKMGHIRGSVENDDTREGSLGSGDRTLSRAHRSTFPRLTTCVRGAKFNDGSRRICLDFRDMPYHVDAEFGEPPSWHLHP